MKKRINDYKAEPMFTYEVKIFRDGVHVDTQIVTAEREGKAQTFAMAQTRVKMSGAMVTFEVTKR